MTSDQVVDDLLRDLGPQVVGILTRRCGSVADAEDAVQEALLDAATQWARDGVPGSPRAWLVTVAGRRLTDRWRSDVARRRREHVAALREPLDAPEVPQHDDTLMLLVLCCDPRLTPASAIPLTLRAVGGLTTAEVARAFLVPESTMAQRISRAKQRLRGAPEPFPVPDAELRAERLPAVLHVLYLIFNEGYAASSGPGVVREDLTTEAIRLARQVHAALPQDAEVAGLLALMLLTEARRPARTGRHGELVPLDAQDRTRWDQGLVAEGVALLTAALPRGAVGPYQLHAAVAAVHDEAPSAEATDWRQVLALYGLLERMTANPMVTLNRAVATAMVEGPRAGLAVLASLDETLGRHHRLSAVRGHLLERSGDIEGALGQYRRAAGLTTSPAERRHLLDQVARLLEGQPDR